MWTTVAIPTDAEILHMILLHEGIDGEYSDDPADSGGPTKYGITIPVLARHRGVSSASLTFRDIELLERPEAEAIYLERFIRPFAGVADPVRLNAIDMGVNAGQSRAIRLLQQTIGAHVDGSIGLETIRLTRVRDWNGLYTGVRLGFYESLVERAPKNLKWRHGWRNRALSFDAARTMPRTLPASRPIFERVGKAWLDVAA